MQIVELGRGGDGDDEECEDARSDHILSYEYDAWGDKLSTISSQQHSPKCINPQNKVKYCYSSSSSPPHNPPQHPTPLGIFKEIYLILLMFTE